MRDLRVVLGLPDGVVVVDVVVGLRVELVDARLEEGRGFVGRENRLLAELLGPLERRVVSFVQCPSKSGWPAAVVLPVHGEGGASLDWAKRARVIATGAATAATAARSETDGP